MGRALRKQTPRTSLAQRTPTSRDAVAHLEEQNRSRLEHLIPLRFGRMLASPFAFFRGTAGLMALDLAQDPHSGIPVLCCGDAHLSNFGFYASPERRLVFDLNDFDEVAIAPWDWDVKRLITSVIVGGEDHGFEQSEIRRFALAAFSAYASSLRAMVEQSPVQRYFVQPHIEAMTAQIDKQTRKVLERSVASARKRTSERVVRRNTERDAQGQLRFIEQTPRMTRLDNLNAPLVEQLFAEYRGTVTFDIASVLAQYLPTDTIRRVVGVGSVGTRCALQLLEGADDDTLVLQVKQANQSVLVQYGGFAQPRRLVDAVVQRGQGARVINGQRLLQAVSDPFLGHLRFDDADFYVRQFHDMKGSVELSELDAEGFRDYGILCATLLARAHSQSPLAAQVVGYIGTSNTAAEAIVDWAFAYAEQSFADYRALQAAAESGRVPVAVESDR
ncbi:DUF2252 domain-containing protein [Gulosibacter chungangensis]|uniref:DUF2252 domain-containing protein n=2 Tax=Gulosibacter chungangensis TaxID=979746 RepID=A0A7J5BGD8_9MICO|nr:DUF2252 domain-containing protein [Gulosibacter chungangensis]